MLIVDVTVSFLLRGPAVLRVFARRIVALPRTRVSLLVLGQVTGTLEFFITFAASLDRFGLLGFSLLASSHGMQKVILRARAARPLHGARIGIGLHNFTSAQRDSLAILNPHELGRTACVTQAAMQAKTFIASDI